MNIFQITIQRQSKAGHQWPIVAEYTRAGVLLPIRTEGILELKSTDFDELYSRLGNPKNYGSYLGQALFQREIANAFVRAMSESQSPLHVLLFVEADELELRVLRWERLCAPIDEGWYLLRLDQRVPFSLYLPSQTDRRFPPIGKRDLQALVIVASPADSERFGLATFDVVSTVTGIREALADIPCDVLAAMDDALGMPSLDELCQRLTDHHKQYTLLHFVCHGRLLDNYETVIYLTNANNQVEPVTAQHLLDRLRGLQGPRSLPHFAFFSTCESASPEAEGALGGLGQRLVRDLGMPAVVAMTETITIKTALKLGKRFYQQLRQSGQVDLALTEASAGLLERDDITFPALYSRLGWQPLFSNDLERELTNLEIKNGLARFQTLLTERAPLLHNQFAQPAKILEDSLETAPTTLSHLAHHEREQALYELNILCQEVCDLSFNALALDQTPPHYEARCPFLGLYPFHAKDREFFFGRDQLIKELQAELVKHQFLAVLGASGSGKSSLVLAGVVPQMQKQFPKLQMVYLTPCADPIAQLLTSQKLAQTPHTISVVDQFEELFTLCDQETQRQQFITELLSLSQQQPVIIIMRADFWGECAPYEDLKTRMQARQFLIAPMNTIELRSAMEQQAAKVGIRFEADLINAILDDIKEEPGAMSLLQHGLQELWKRRHGRWLKTTEYREGIGGIKQVIAKTADEVYHRLSLTEQTQFQNIFIRLTRLDDSTVPGKGYRDTRRRVGLEELVMANTNLSAIKKLVTHLADARLVVTNVNIVNHREELEVAHEALIRYWPRLANWLDENRHNLQLRETIRQAALTWVENQKKEDYLVHKGVRLEDAKLLARQTGFLNPLETSYVKACVALAQAAEKAVRRRWQIAFISLTIGIIIAVSLAGFAFVQMKKAEKQAQLALVEKLGTQSLVATLLPSPSNGAYEQAVLLAAQAFKEQSDSDVSRGNLLRVLQAKKQQKIILYGHFEYVKSVTPSPGGKFFASGGDDNRVRLWDIATGQALGEPLVGHSAEVWSVDFSPDGHRLASSSGDHTVRLWDIATRQAIGEPLTGHSAPIYSVAFSPDGKLLASASLDHSVRLWDVATGLPLGKPLIGHFNQIYSVAFSPDGKLLASGGKDERVILWDVATQQPFGKPLTGHSDRVYSVVFSPDGQTLASGSWDNSVRLWQVATRQMLGEPLIGHSSGVLTVTFSPNGKILASGSKDQTIRLWDVTTGQALDEPLIAHSDWVRSLAFTPNGKTLISASLDQSVRLWDINTQQTLGKRLTGHLAEVLNVAFSPDGKVIASASWDKTVRFWEVATRKALGEPLTGHFAPVYSVAFSPNNQILATASHDRTIRLWNVATRQLLGKPLTGHSSGVLSIAFSPNGKILASGGQDQTVRLWDITTGQAIGKPFTGHANGVLSVAFSPDGQILASASHDKTVMLWHVATGQPVGEPLTGHANGVLSVAFSPDGQILASGSADETVRLWDVATKPVIGKPLTGHSHQVTSVAFSPDGKLLASASLDETVRLWEVATKQALGEPLTGHANVVHSVAFSPDSKLLASGSDDYNVILWDVNPESWLKQLCLVVNRNFSQTEWHQYMGERLHEKTCPNLPKDTLSALGHIRQGEQLALAGEITAAVNKFKQARQLDARFVTFDLTTKAKAFAAQGLVNEGEILAQQGEIDQAIAKYQAAQQMNPKVKIYASQWTTLCRYGSLYGQAIKILNACEKALTLTPEKWYVRDSRGLASALTGEIQAAIDDFQFAIEKSDDEKFKKERQTWLIALKNGENPFTEEVLQKLR